MLAIELFEEVDVVSSLDMARVEMLSVQACLGGD